jgi:hypothetical protein
VLRGLVRVRECSGLVKGFFFFFFSRHASDCQQATTVAMYPPARELLVDMHRGTVAMSSFFSVTRSRRGCLILHHQTCYVVDTQEAHRHRSSPSGQWFRPIPSHGCDDGGSIPLLWRPRAARRAHRAIFRCLPPRNVGTFLLVFSFTRQIRGAIWGRCTTTSGLPVQLKWFRSRASECMSFGAQVRVLLDLRVPRRGGPPTVDMLTAQTALLATPHRIKAIFLRCVFDFSLSRGRG